MSIQSFEEFTRLNSSKIEPISKKIEPLLTKTPIEKPLKESAFLVGDDYKVKIVLDIPKSLVQQYIQKVKDETDKDPLDTFSESEIAEQIVSFLIKTNLKIDNLTPEFTVGSDIDSKNDTENDTEEGLQEIEDDNSFDYSTKSKPFKKENDIEMDIPSEDEDGGEDDKGEDDFEEISFDKVELDETKPTPDISVSKKPKTIGDLKKQEKSFDIVPNNIQSEEEEISRLYKNASGYDYDSYGQYEKIYFDLKTIMNKI